MKREKEKERKEALSIEFYKLKRFFRFFLFYFTLLYTQRERFRLKIKPSLNSFYIHTFCIF